MRLSGLVGKRSRFDVNGQPQPARPHGAGNRLNAAMTERCGPGLNREPAGVDAAPLKTLPHGQGLRAFVRDGVRAPAAEPGPGPIVPRLPGLTGRWDRPFFPVLPIHLDLKPA
ncbi:hypothetical protein AB0C93_37265 [Streptomyces sp. NPDC048518]|uniref:hypothetical protein n=1 Tax=Streptomyces sp. NPDC048518 TaxID=3155029 RepID=UPI0033F71E6D